MPDFKCTCSFCYGYGHAYQFWIVYIHCSWSLSCIGFLIEEGVGSVVGGVVSLYCPCPWDGVTGGVDSFGVPTLPGVDLATVDLSVPLPVRKIDVL